MRLSSFVCGVLPTIASLASAALVSYDWHLGFAVKNPDGKHPRRVVAVNGQWPPPTIEAKLGDTIKVVVHNGMEDEVTSIHFHGMFHLDKGFSTHQMDGMSSAIYLSPAQRPTDHRLFMSS
jgi:iron transport multicopper oxidase